MYTCYMSGLHAMNATLQIHSGLTRSVEVCEALWDNPDMPLTMNANMLASHLRGEGLPAIAWVAAAEELVDLARGAFEGGYTVLLRLHPDLQPGAQTWALLWEDTAYELRLAECVGTEGSPALDGDITRWLVGEAVVVEEDPGPNRLVTAFMGHVRN